MLVVTARFLYNLAAVLWKRATFQLIILMGFAALAHRGTAFGLPDRSVSSSRQFIVYGADVPVRGAVCALAERTKSSLLQLLHQSDRWKTAILVNLQYPQANVPEIPESNLALSQTGSGLKIQLDFLITTDVNVRAFQRRLLGALLLEMMYRGEPDLPAGDVYLSPPDWLVEGILMLVRAQDDDSSGDVLGTIVAANQITSLDEILGQRADLLEATSLQVFRAYAMVLVRLLADSPGGRERLSHYIEDLWQASNDPASDLRSHFPLIPANAQEAEKWWKQNITRFPAADAYVAFSADETKARLDQLLKITLPTPNGSQQDYRFDDFDRFPKSPSRAAILRRRSQELMLLSTQSHPIYRPIVQEYQAIAALLSKNKTHRIARRLAGVESYRREIDDQMRDIDDYMNWFEATQISASSGAFSDYLQGVRAVEEPEPRRRDPISVYLDSIESQLE
jgi:hypothetical protein